MFLKIPHSVQIDALETAQDLWIQNDYYRRCALRDFTGPELEAQLADIQIAQDAVLNFVAFTKKGMPSC